MRLNKLLVNNKNIFVAIASGKQSLQIKNECNKSDGNYANVESRLFDEITLTD